MTGDTGGLSCPIPTSPRGYLCLSHETNFGASPLLSLRLWACLLQHTSRFRCFFLVVLRYNWHTGLCKFVCLLLTSPRDMLIDLRESGREGETDGEKHRCKRETSVGCLPDVPCPGTKPTTQPGALTGGQTCDL